ncbi:MAG: hypothetical protein LAP21_08450 [Acidobacteriia bacterium]|nr:hypothetical protein [Terriglobia bacterium]
MTFLKKLGVILVNLTGVAAGVGPLLKPFLGSGAAADYVSKGVNDLTAIGGTIVQIETAFAAVPGSNGAIKMQACIPLVGNIIKTSELVAGKKIANEALFQKAVEGYAQATTDLLNSIHADEAAHAS